MVALLDVLEGKGLVARRPHEGDRRRNVIELTDHGRETLRRGTEASDAAERAFLAPLDPQDAERLRDSLQRALARPAES
ncbi:MarR family winged helix-turn-helix transcriptional regulator [Actinomadura roseirufa]|uniref:MarR family winged helix-turn-helix transcriptional regulator n=1 Tax=Actinomadura roseirufa TaxID=2094049 RepID=UPI001041B298